MTLPAWIRCHCLLCLALMLGGCGLKGNLYLPERNAASSSASSSASSDTAASDRTP